MRTKTRTERMERQSFANRLSHWSIAVSTLLLFVTGFGQMPVYSRYGIASLPGMAWLADYQTTLLIHYLAGAVLAFGVTYHVMHAIATRSFAIWPRRGDLKESAQIIGAMMGFGEEPDSHKYLAEQRVAYAFIGANTVVVLISGFVKVAKNLPGSQIPFELVWLSTLAHNIAAGMLLVGILGHFAAFAIKANRKLLPAMLDGTVETEYARERHGLWFEEISSPEEDVEKAA